MQTDILLKHLHTSLASLKLAIDKFEKHPSPSTQYTEQLHLAIHESNKLVSAYLVLKEQNDLSPELNLHVKLMNAVLHEEKIIPIESVKEVIIVEPIIDLVIEEEPIEIKNEVVIEKVEAPIEEKIIEPVIAEANPFEKDLPKMAININDKFRFINELFASNAAEYNIAIEQINATQFLDDLNNYLKGLMSIYEWKENNEVVKNFNLIARKRFS